MAANKNFESILKGGDLRSLGKADKVINSIKTQNDFDAIFELLFHEDRRIVMRASDIIEKVTLNDGSYLQKHKKEIIRLAHEAENKELKWHLALILPRLLLTKNEKGIAWHLLTSWASDRNESRIVRVNSIQGLFTILQSNKDLLKDFLLTISAIQDENIPSINARIKKFMKTDNRLWANKK